MFDNVRVQIQLNSILCAKLLIVFYVKAAI